MTAEQNQTQPEAKPLDLFLSFKGRIGRRAIRRRALAR